MISFYSQDPALDSAVNTHRVVEIRQENNTIVFVTKGDNNNVVDSYDVPGEYLIGKVVASSNKLGKFSRLVANPLIFIPIILIPLIIILFSNLFETYRMAKQIAKEEEEAAVEEAIRKIKARQKRKKITVSHKIDKNTDKICKFLVTFQTFYGKLIWYIKKCGRRLKNEQKRRKRVKVF